MTFKDRKKQQHESNATAFLCQTTLNSQKTLQNNLPPGANLCKALAWSNIYHFSFSFAPALYRVCPVFVSLSTRIDSASEICLNIQSRLSSQSVSCSLRGTRCNSKAACAVNTARKWLRWLRGQKVCNILSYIRRNTGELWNEKCKTGVYWENQEGWQVCWSCGPAAAPSSVHCQFKIY